MNVRVVEKMYVGKRLDKEVWEYKLHYFIARIFSDGVVQLTKATMAQENGECYFYETSFRVLNGHNTDDYTQAQQFIKENY